MPALLVTLATSVVLFVGCSPPGRSSVSRSSGDAPGCSARTASGKVRPATGSFHVGGAPFGVAAAPRAESGDPRTVLGALRPTRARGSRPFGTVEVAVSPDDRLVAASDEDHGTITLFDLRRAVRSGFAGPVDVVQVPVDPRPTGVAFSADGALLFATSQRLAGDHSDAVDVQGALSVIDVGEATRGTRGSVRSKVAAGCTPVRVAVAPDRRTVWVTARASNALLAFDLGRLVDARPGALCAWSRVGPAPVGLVATRDGRAVIVANSNRFVAPRLPSTATIVDSRSMLAGRARIRSVVRVGGFPRDAATLADGQTAVITDYGTGDISILRGG